VTSPLLEAVAVMDRLRSPGGCPWDAAQTHRSLARYLLEETYETLDAIAADDPVLLREELGDLLFQVLFHARLGAELEAEQRFSIDDVAADAVAKLIRRHPHVFADTVVSGADEVVVNWDEIKQQEKQRTSVTDGVPLAQPSLALSAKLLERASRAGLAVAEPAAADSSADAPETDFGARLFVLAAEAVRAGIDPELALRETALRFADAVRQAESAR
jgi:XTP/dITP diphosphohydrolase